MAIVDDCIPLHNRAIDIHVMDHPIVHAHHRRVVHKIVPTPHAAHESDAHVAEAVIHAAVVTHVIAPIAGVVNVKSVLPSPPWRGP